MTRQRLDEMLASEGIGVCMRDAEQRVLSQNEHCREVCGERGGTVCDNGCIRLCEDDTARADDSEGSRLYADSEIFGRACDVTVIQSGDTRMTLLQPLEARHRRALSAFIDAGLSAREMAVIELVVQGLSNSQICERLNIARATLRTHLNRAYRKAREHGVEPLDLPPSRQAELRD